MGDSDSRLKKKTDLYPKHDDVSASIKWKKIDKKKYQFLES